MTPPEPLRVVPQGDDACGPAEPLPRRLLA